MADTKPKSSGKASDTKTRSVTEIEADLAVRRDRLSRTVDELADKVSPATLKARGTARVNATIAEVKGQAKGRVAEVKGQAGGAAYDEHGNVRLDKVAAVLGSVSAVCILLGLARRTFYRG